MYFYRSGFYLQKLKLKRKINDNLRKILKNKEELAFFPENLGLWNGAVEGMDHFIEAAKIRVIEIKNQPR